MVVHMNLKQLMCNEINLGNIILSINRTTYEVHTFKNKSKRKPFLSFSRSCKFVIIITRTYDIAHDEKAMSSFIIQII